MLEKLKMYSLPYGFNHNKYSNYNKWESKLNDESDIFLTNEVKLGNEDAFAVLVQRYAYIIVYNISKMSVSFPQIAVKWSDKEDLYQECCIVLYKAAKYYNLVKNAKFSTYLNVCVKNYLISFFRKHRKKSYELVSIDDIPENDYGIYDQYSVFNEYDDSVFKILTNFERKVFFMYIEQKSYKYIAEILNKNIKSIDNALCRIKTKLKPYVKSFILN